MLYILLSWFYITSIIYLNGALLISLLKRAFSVQTEKPIHFAAVSVLGMAFVTLIAILFSLFYKVDLAANVTVAITAIAYVVLGRKQLQSDWAYYKREVRNTPVFIAVLLLLYAFIAAYISSIPSSHYDDGLYYLGSIKWLQEYGSVKGLANLNPRFGFNSSWLILQSLFGFHFLQAGPFNDLNGLLYILMLLYSLQGIARLLKRDNRLVTFLQALFFIPAIAVHFPASHDFILYNVNLFSSPSPDVPASFIMWLTFLVFLSKDTTDQEKLLKSLITVILCCFLVTIKLSAAPLVLIVIFLLWPFAKKKQFSYLLLAISICAVFVLPWLARNVVVSGYLLFPFSKLDLFNVDWKVPIGSVKWHENAVKIWAINPEYDLNKELTVPLTQWLPEWFERLSFIQSTVVITIIVSSLCFFLVFIVNLFNRKSSFLKENSTAVAYVLVSIVGILFWFIKGPDLRLGFGFTIFFCIFAIAALIKFFVDSFSFQAGIAVLGIFYAIFIFYYKDVWGNAPLKKLTESLPVYSVPKQYETLPLSTTVNLYITKDEPCQNCMLPCITNTEYSVLGTMLRGQTIQEGFKARQ